MLRLTCIKAHLNVLPDVDKPHERFQCLIPQHYDYNSVTHPGIDGVVGIGHGLIITATIFGNLDWTFFAGKLNKVAYDFCLSVCPETDQTMTTKLLKVSLASNPLMEEN